MANTAPGKLSGYETTFITRSELSDDALKALQERVNQVVTSFQGETVLTEDWGKRKLAYPIEKESRECVMKVKDRNLCQRRRTIDRPSLVIVRHWMLNEVCVRAYLLGPERWWALAPMKNAVKRDISCDTHFLREHRVFERNLESLWEARRFTVVGTACSDYTFPSTH